MTGRLLTEEELVAAAEELGRRCRGGEVILLDGAMGAGKTTWTRGLARGLGIVAVEEVRSPTFTVCMEHTGRVDLVHVDLFRLGEEGHAGGLSAAFEALGLDDAAVGRAGAVTVVEWAELWAAPPLSALRIHLNRPKNVTDLREITVTRGVSWSEGWPP